MIGRTMRRVRRARKVLRCLIRGNHGSSSMFVGYLVCVECGRVLRKGR